MVLNEQLVRASSAGTGLALTSEATRPRKTKVSVALVL